jgi:hypothetical protein
MKVKSRNRFQEGSVLGRLEHVPHFTDINMLLYSLGEHLTHSGHHFHIYPRGYHGFQSFGVSCSLCSTPEYLWTCNYEILDLAREDSVIEVLFEEDRLGLLEGVLEEMDTFRREFDSSADSTAITIARRLAEEDRAASVLSDSRKMRLIHLLDAERKGYRSRRVNWTNGREEKIRKPQVEVQRRTRFEREDVI